MENVRYNGISQLTGKLPTGGMAAIYPNRKARSCYNMHALIFNWRLGQIWNILWLEVQHCPNVKNNISISLPAGRYTTQVDNGKLQLVVYNVMCDQLGELCLIIQLQDVICQLEAMCYVNWEKQDSSWEHSISAGRCASGQFGRHN